MNDQISKHDHVLLSLVMQFQTIAMIHLGKMADPHTGEVHRNLDAARGSIDVLEMLKVKCRDNTPQEIVKMLDQSVMDLQMNYLDEMKKPQAQAGADDTGEAAGSDAADAADAAADDEGEAT